MKLKTLYELKREPERPVTWGFIQQTIKDLDEEFQKAGYHTAVTIKRIIMYPTHSWAQLRITNEEWTYDGQKMVTINTAVKDWPHLGVELYKWFEGDIDYEEEGTDINLNDDDAMNELWEFVREHLPLL